MKDYRNNRRKKSMFKLQIAWIVTCVAVSLVLLFTATKIFNNKKEPGNDKNGTNIAGNDSQGNKNDNSKPSISPEGLKEDVTGTPSKAPDEEKNTPSDVPDVTEKPTSTPEPTKKPTAVPKPTKAPEVTKIPDKGSDDDRNSDDDKDNQEERKVIALTFDDGPFPAVTDRILKVLKDNGAKATFFVMGGRMESYGSTVKKAFEQGCEIGNHTINHQDLTKLSKEKVKYEVEHSNELINGAADVGDVLLRPPYGNKNDAVGKYVKVPMVNWSVDTEDWKSKNKDKIIESVLSTVKDGDIVLMHDLYTSTAEAVEYLVPELIKQGYELVTVHELFEAKGITLEAGELYRSAKGN